MQTNQTLAKEKKAEASHIKRKEIELELEEPIGFKTISPKGEKVRKEGQGEMLTFDGQGILIVTDKPLEEGSLVNLSIKFKGLGLLDGILGKVKKVEESEEHDFLVGVELYSEEKIKAEALSGLLPVKMQSFNTKLKKSLLEYFNLNKSRDKISSYK